MNERIEQQEIYFSGQVQGVGFRYTAQDVARRYPGTGFVQNLRDGRVRMVVEGRFDDVDSVLADLQSRMQPYIRSVDRTSHPASGAYGDFSIRV
jgi:acylphosphatase